MSDFRLPLTVNTFEFSDRELDWDRRTRRWTLSDKEYGSVTWALHQEPSEADFDGLRDFFEIPRTFMAHTVSVLSPGELAALHAHYEEPPRIRATLCETCSEHWIVYKLSGTAWLKYGRRCGFSWWYGDPVTDTKAWGMKAV